VCWIACMPLLTWLLVVCAITSTPLVAWEIMTPTSMVTTSGVCIIILSSLPWLCPLYFYSLSRIYTCRSPILYPNAFLYFPSLLPHSSPVTPFPTLIFSLPSYIVPLLFPIAFHLPCHLWWRRIVPMIPLQSHIQRSKGFLFFGRGSDQQVKIRDDESYLVLFMDAITRSHKIFTWSLSLSW
jgi:hypothetical protein